VSAFDADSAREFDILQKISKASEFHREIDVSARIAMIQGLETHIQSMRSILAQLDHEIISDAHHRTLSSLQSSNSYERVWTSEFFLSELDLVRSNLSRTTPLLSVTKELSQVLQQYQQKRWEVGHDRIEYESLWNSLFWEELDAIQNDQLELNVNMLSYFEARSRNLAGSRSRREIADASFEIQKLQRAISALQRENQRTQIAFDCELRSAQSEFVVKLQQLREANSRQIEQLRDQKDGLNGMLDERIDVLRSRLMSPADREKQLTVELYSLSEQLATAHERLTDLRSSLPVRKSKSLGMPRT